MARYIKAEDAIPYLTKYIPSVEAIERSEYEKLKYKLDKIERIVTKWNNDASNSFGDMCKINGILRE